MKAKMTISENEKFLNVAKKQQIMDMTPEQLDDLFTKMKPKQKDELLKFLTKAVISLLHKN